MRKSSKTRVAVYLQNYYLEHDWLKDHLEKYKSIIKEEPSWEFIGAYKDFDNKFTGYVLNKLKRDCEKGKVDLIFTHSISEITSSLAETLNLTRSLNEIGVEIIFEKEKLDTRRTRDQETLKRLGAAIEIENKVNNVKHKWLIDKRFEKGEPVFARMLGYRLKDKEWVIVPEEAKTVKEAFKLYLKRYRLLEIARQFIVKNYKKANGRKDWSARAIEDILKNEKYTGDVYRKKAEFEDMNESKEVFEVKNEQILIKNHHKAIISHAVFDEVNQMLGKGAKTKTSVNKKTYPLSGRLRCKICGGNFQRYLNRGLVTWRCGMHIKSKSLCSMKGIKEEILKAAVTRAFFDEFDSEWRNITKLVEILRQVENFKEEKITTLQSRIENLINKENVLILSGDNQRDETLIKLLDEEKNELETLIQSRTELLKLLEEDYQYRLEVIKILKEFMTEDDPLNSFKQAMTEWQFIRAWIINVGAFNPLSFEITWVTGSTSTIELEAGA